ncbi:MAG: glycoside hydrolase family 25 protein [Butyrivibrio sp.]|nr:glycoside hydrolase family 25 protein [Butyrivibrio sp.]
MGTIIGGIAVCLCIGIALSTFLHGKETKANEAGIIVEEIDSDSIAAESGTEENDITAFASSENDPVTETSVSSSTASSEGSSEITETVNDPATIAGNETGAVVDVAKVLSASSVGENSSLTHGIDVSRFQGTINWEEVANSGIDFVMVRVGYRDSSTGEIKADSNAKYNMQEAEKYGIKIGAYFFSTAVTTDEAAAEANWVTDYISQYPITYPVGYNCEGFESASSRQYGLSKDDRSSIAMAFLDNIYNAGYTPIFYAAESELLADEKWNTSQIQQKYKIWLAWYNQDTSNIASGPSYDGQCAMWQYTNQGNIAGIDGPVDVDVAYFGYDGTENAKDTSERESVAADVEALMNFEEVNENVTAKSSTNLRNKPSQGDDSTVVLTLQNGQVATRTGISSSGWSRVVYEGTVYYAVSSFLTTDLSAPAQTEEVVEDTSGFKTKFTDCNEVVTAKDIVNLRSKPSVTDEDSAVVATLSNGETAIRTGINNDYGWSRVEYNGQVLYCVSSYLQVVQ